MIAVSRDVQNERERERRAAMVLPCAKCGDHGGRKRGTQKIPARYNVPGVAGRLCMDCAYPSRSPGLFTAPLSRERIARRIVAAKRLQLWIARRSKTPRRCLRLCWEDLPSAEFSRLLRQRFARANHVLLETLFTPYVDPIREEYDTDE